MVTQFDHIPVLHALHGTGVVPLPQVDARPDRTAYQHGFRRCSHEALHTAALVGLEVRYHHVGQSGRVEDLGHGGPDVVIHRVGPGVDEGGAFVVDEELVEAQALLRCEGTNAIDAIANVIDPSHRLT